MSTNVKKVSSKAKAMEVNKEVTVLTNDNHKPVEQDKAEPLVNKDSLYTTQVAIDEAIELAVVSGNNLQVEYQRIACSVILHVAKHHDIRVARKLVETLPEGMRKRSMSAFIDKFAPVSFDEEGEMHYDKNKKADIAGSLSFAWWKAASEGKYVPFILANELQKLLDRAMKRLDRADPERGDVVTGEQVAALSRLVATVHKADETKAQQLTASHRVA